MGFSLVKKLLQVLFGNRPSEPTVRPPAERITVRVSPWLGTLFPRVTQAALHLDQFPGQILPGAIEDTGRIAFALPEGALEGWGAWLDIEADGAELFYERVTVARDIDVELEPVVSPLGIEGPVRLEGRAFADDGGPWLAFGASGFWAAWGTLYDPDRLKENLAYLEGKVDYLRVLAVVGPGGGLWEDRTVTAKDVLVTNVVADTTDLLASYGIRTQWTIFGGIDTASTPALREQVVDRVIAQLRDRLSAVQLVEIANEGWQNGFDGESGRQELIRLADRVRQALPSVPVALTAPADGNVPAFYDGSTATIATVHTERDVHGTGGLFRPVRQAREFVDMGPWVNNEPIGPQSSVAADDNPERLALAAVYTWLCNGAGYVYHTGAGIRGGGLADRLRGRSAAFRDVPGFAVTTDLIGRVRRLLPADLPNWRWVNSNSRFDYLFELPYEADGTRLLAPEDDLLRAFAAYGPDRQFVCVPIAVTAPVRLTAAAHLRFAVRDIRTLDRVEEVELRAGESYVLQPTPGALLTGRWV